MDLTFTEHEGDKASALALVISLNVQRRDLTAAQRAVVAARTLEQFPERRGGDRTKQSALTGHNGKSRDDVAGVFKVGKNAVQQARALLSESPDLASQVESCSLSLAAAYEQLQSRRKDFSPMEAISLGERLEQLERPKAKERQAKAGPAEGKGKKASGSGKLPEPLNGRTRDRVGEAVGMSGRTYEKAKAVAAAANGRWCWRRWESTTTRRRSTCG